jgi:hypothetical protein
MQNTLQLNNGNGKFNEIANYAGVNASDWSWGALFFDADNDGYNDIYVCNGIYQDVTDQDFINFFADEVNQKMVMTGKKAEIDAIISKMPSHPIKNKAFRNNGNLKFSDEGENWGFTTPSFSNGASYADLDNDGDLDLIVNNVNSKAFVYKNNSQQKNKDNHFISFKLQSNTKNTFAIGSQIQVFRGHEILSREIMPSRGFQSSTDYKSIIGLGTNKVIDSVMIIWPDRTKNLIRNPTIDSNYIINQANSNPAELNNLNKKATPLFKEITNNFDAIAEDDYVDFYNERLVPFGLSKQGPKIAKGDVNGDGLEDIFIGGTNAQPGQLYLQNVNGYVKSPSPEINKFIGFEDGAVLFFDADKDGDLDLFIGAGGNNVKSANNELMHRLFINDGKGNFKLSQRAFPANNSNIATAVSGDFDQDGDIDLFVGSRCLTQDYGSNPQSYIYINDGTGYFNDIGNKNSSIANYGMITAATFGDINGDKKPELIITGEWTGITAFEYTGNNKFSAVKTGLENLHGFWQSISIADLDNDGDLDIVAGNLGNNFYLKADENHPLKLFIKDFDNNGSLEKIITRTVEGKDMPVFMKRELEEQMPALKKKNLRFEKFGEQDVLDLFGKEAVEKATVKNVNYLSSIIALNNGQGIFAPKALMPAIQFSCINSILCTDINNDGLIDIIMGGNNFNLLPQFGRLDANRGNVLINSGKAKFNNLSSEKSGIDLSGEVRDIQIITIHNKKHLLFTINSKKPVCYEMP